MSYEIDLYKKFMEGLLEKRIDVRVKTVKEGQGWPKVEMYEKYNEFYNTLNDEQKQILGNMLQESRDDAIFETLEYFDNKIDIENLHITQNGIEFPNDFYGGDFHCDWVALCQGDFWGED